MISLIGPDLSRYDKDTNNCAHYAQRAITELNAVGVPAERFLIVDGNILGTWDGEPHQTVHLITTNRYFEPQTGAIIPKENADSYYKTAFDFENPTFIAMSTTDI